LVAVFFQAAALNIRSEVPLNSSSDAADSCRALAFLNIRVHAIGFSRGGVKAGEVSQQQTVDNTGLAAMTTATGSAF